MLGLKIVTFFTAQTYEFVGRLLRWYFAQMQHCTGNVLCCFADSTFSIRLFIRIGFNALLILCVLKSHYSWFEFFLNGLQQAISRKKELTQHVFSFFVAIFGYGNRTQIQNIENYHCKLCRVLIYHFGNRVFLV